MEEFPLGTQARIHALKGDSELNGEACVSLGPKDGAERVQVRLVGGRELAVRPANLDKAPSSSQPGSLLAGSRVILTGLKTAGLNGREGEVAALEAPPGRVLVDLGDDGAAKSIKVENVVWRDPAAAKVHAASQAAICATRDIFTALGKPSGGADSDDEGDEGRPTKAQRLDVGKGKGKGKCKRGWYWDDHSGQWVSNEKGEELRKEREKSDEFARTLFCALELCEAKSTGTGVPLTQIGSDFKVRRLREDAQFKNKKLVEILKEYPRVFDVSGSPGKWIVKLREEADIALPQRVAGESAPQGAGDVLPDPEELLLPDKMEDPKNVSEKMQALRVELIHALQRRNGKATPSEIGQEPGVQKIKRELLKSKRIVDFVRFFPENFSVDRDSDTSQNYISLGCKDVEDKSAIERVIKALQERADESEPSRKDKGKGKRRLERIRERERTEGNKPSDTAAHATAMAAADAAAHAVAAMRQTAQHNVQSHSPSFSAAPGFAPHPLPHGYPAPAAHGCPPAAAVGYPPPATCYPPPATGYPPPAGSYPPPPVAGYPPPACGYHHPVAGYHGYPPPVQAYPHPPHVGYQQSPVYAHPPPRY